MGTATSLTFRTRPSPTQTSDHDAYDRSDSTR